MSSDRLWSPQMRKWARDSEKHGIPIGFHKTKPGRHHSTDWAGGSGIYLTRVADDEGIRVIDGPNLNVKGPIRTVDGPLPFQATIPVYLVADNGITLLHSESDIQLTP